MSPEHVPVTSYCIWDKTQTLTDLVSASLSDLRLVYFFSFLTPCQILAFLMFPELSKHASGPFTCCSLCCLEFSFLLACSLLSFRSLLLTVIGVGLPNPKFQEGRKFVQFTAVSLAPRLVSGLQ